MKENYVVSYVATLETTMIFRYDVYKNKTVNQYIVGYYAGMPDDESTQDIIKNDCGGEWVCGFDYKGWVK